MAEPQKRRDIVGVIVFDGERFLLLHRVKNWKGWEYPKGGIEDGEEKGGAVGRELFEETGIRKFELVGMVSEYAFFDKVRGCDSVIRTYLVRVSSNSKVAISENQPADRGGKKIIEHDGYRWCQPEEALKLLTHDDMRATMGKAIKMLGLQVK